LLSQFVLIKKQLYNRIKDELFKYTFASLSRFYVEMRIRVEGGKVTPLTKLQVALKKLLGRL